MIVSINARIGLSVSCTGVEHGSCVITASANAKHGTAGVTRVGVVASVEHGSIVGVVGVGVKHGIACVACAEYAVACGVIIGHGVATEHRCVGVIIAKRVTCVVAERGSRRSAEQIFLLLLLGIIFK